MHRLLPVIAIWLLLLPYQSCVSRRTTGGVNLHASMTQTVLVAEASYEAIMKGLGDSFRAGVIDSATLEHGREMGVQAHNAIDTAKSTLRTYLQTQAIDGGDTSKLFKALATMSTLIARLQEFYGENTGALVEVQ